MGRHLGLLVKINLDYFLVESNTLAFYTKTQIECKIVLLHWPVGVHYKTFYGLNKYRSILRVFSTARQLYRSQKIVSKERSQPLECSFVWLSIEQCVIDTHAENNGFKPPQMSN